MDLGFSVTCSELTELQKNFYAFDLNPVAAYLRSNSANFSIAHLGHSYLFTIGKVTVTDSDGCELLMGASINNFIGILCDGSIKYRILLISDPSQSMVSINHIMCMYRDFRVIYTMLLGEGFDRIFVHAHKYERLQVLKQFTPYYDFPESDTGAIKFGFNNFLSSHQIKYGNNLIVEGNRLPKNDYIIIDKKHFSDYNIIQKN